MVELGTSSTFRGWVRVRVLGYGSVVRGRKVKSRDCALASDLVRATFAWFLLALLAEKGEERRERRSDERGARSPARQHARNLLFFNHLTILIYGGVAGQVFLIKNCSKI